MCLLFLNMYLFRCKMLLYKKYYKTQMVVSFLIRKSSSVNQLLGTLPLGIILCRYVFGFGLDLIWFLHHRWPRHICLDLIGKNFPWRHKLIFQVGMMNPQLPIKDRMKYNLIPVQSKHFQKKDLWADFSKWSFSSSLPFWLAWHLALREILDYIANSWTAIGKIRTGWDHCFDPLTKDNQD